MIDTDLWQIALLLAAAGKSIDEISRSTGLTTQEVTSLLESVND